MSSKLSFFTEKITSYDETGAKVSLKYRGDSQHQTCIGGTVSLFAYVFIMFNVVTQSISWGIQPN